MEKFHRKPLYLMVKTYGFPVKMFPKKPIHWYEGYHGTVDHFSWLNPMKSQFFNINHGKISPETPTNLMVKTYGFPVKMFPNKPIHQRGHWRFPGWWIISAEGLGLIGDSKSSWEKRARSHRANPTGNIEKDVQKAMETEWFRERVYNWWMFMDFPHWTLSLLEGKYHKIVIYQLNNGILPLQNWDLTMKNWDSKFHPMSWVSSIAMSISTCGVIQITCFFDSQCVFPFEMMKSAWSVGFPYFPCFTGRYWDWVSAPCFSSIHGIHGS